jgi:two-component system, OmpR family, alkaline phosphatase synthesis response regulator PhoP
VKQKILLVDDEKDIIEFLEYNLIQEGYDVISANDGLVALEKLAAKPDLIVLDVLMPKMNGYEVCAKIRESEDYKNIPVLFLTAKVSEMDEVHGLSIGADDYITKPISPKKLIARIKANLRRADSENQLKNKLKINIGPIAIDREKYSVFIEKEQIVFPRKEFEILSYLASQPGRVFHRDKILNDIWGSDVLVVDRTIDVHVRKIREKLGKYADLIETIKGVGYRFKNVE